LIFVISNTQNTMLSLSVLENIKQNLLTLLMDLGQILARSA